MFAALLVFVSCDRSQLRAPFDPCFIPVPGTSYIHPVAFGRVLCIFAFPELDVLRVDPELRKTRLSDFNCDLFRPEFRPFNLLLHPVFFVNRFGEFRGRVDKLNDLVRLAGTIYKLPLKEKAIRVVRAGLAKLDSDISGKAAL